MCSIIKIISLKMIDKVVFRKVFCVLDFQRYFIINALYFFNLFPRKSNLYEDSCMPPIEKLLHKISSLQVFFNPLWTV